VKSLAKGHAEMMVTKFERLGHGASTNSEWKILISELLGSAHSEGIIDGERRVLAEQRALRDFR
jgi:hypothetical protein